MLPRNFDMRFGLYGATKICASPDPEVYKQAKMSI